MYTIKAIAVLVLVLFVVEAVAFSKKRNKVLILGGGLSGIKAAKTLLDNGITDFLILEAQDHIGGRIHAVPFAGMSVESGANWIHFIHEEDTKPLMKRKRVLHTDGIYCNYSDIIIRDDRGKDITDFHVYEKYHHVVEEKIEEYIEERANQGGEDLPARVGMQLMGWKPTKPIEDVVEYFNFDFEFARSPDIVAFYSMFSRGEDFFVTDQRGVWSLYQDLYKPLTSHILLRKVVKKIKYSPTSVEVTTSDGDVFTADYALCTFSTGVLASDSVLFEPPLPQDKIEAILKSPMGVYTKIFMKFPRKFWDDHEYILHASKVRGQFPVFQDLSRPGIFSSAVLLATVTGEEGRRIEGQPTNKTEAEVMKTLRRIYGATIPNPTAIYYRRWSRNKFTLGAYSDAVVGRSSEEISKLGENLGRVYFAGEATSEDWFGYMQGAYITGKEKGEIIAEKVLSLDK